MTSVVWEEARVVSTRDAASGVRRIEISPAAGVRRFDAGSHIDVQVQVHGRMEVRSYSLVGEPNATSYVIAVRKLPEGRGGSMAMGELVDGQQIQVSAPKNFFGLSLASSAYLLLAGGIGITPLVGMAQTLKRRGAKVRMVYVGRTRASMPFLAELSELLGDDLLVHADGESGQIDLASIFRALDKEGETYVCGPTSMLEAARAFWVDSGRPAHRMRFETFASSGHAAPQSFVVDIPRLGKRITVPADRNMLDVLEEAGAEPLFNCRRGECGLCAVEILDLDGTVDHRDVFFSDRQKKESTHMCSCVSRVSGRSVTINLP